MATVRQVNRSAPASTEATVPQQGAFSAPPFLAVCSHKEAVDYLIDMSIAVKVVKTLSNVTMKPSYDIVTESW